jgi:hypothetical protein
MQYTEAQINRLAEEAPWTTFYGPSLIEEGEIMVYRFALFGGAPHDSPPSAHINVLKAMAATPGVDSEAYEVLGVTLLPIPNGTLLGDQGGNEVTAPDRSWICDVVFRSIWGGTIVFDGEDQAAVLRDGLATWGGGYTPIVKNLCWIGTRVAEDQTYSALQFWGTQSPMFYGTNKGEPVAQNAFKPNAGTLGVGLSTGLSDDPANLVPMKWSTMTQPQPITPLPVDPGSPGAPVTVPSGSGATSSNQGLLVLGACSVAGYFLYKAIWSAK